MAEEFVNANLILPGTYIRVRSEGLIGVAGVSTGNIGVVGTAAQGLGATQRAFDGCRRARRLPVLPMRSRPER